MFWTYIRNNPLRKAFSEYICTIQKIIYKCMIDREYMVFIALVSVSRPV